MCIDVWGTCSLATQAFFSCVTAAAGFGSFAYMLIVYENYNFAVWAFVCGIVSLSVTLLHTLYLKHKVDEWYDENSLDNLEIFGVLIASLAFVFFGFYLTSAITKHQEFTPLSMYLPAVASCLSVFWSLVLCIACRKYKKFVRMCEMQPNNCYSNYDSYQRF